MAFNGLFGWRWLRELSYYRNNPTTPNTPTDTPPSSTDALLLEDGTALLLEDGTSMLLE